MSKIYFRVTKNLSPLHLFLKLVKTEVEQEENIREIKSTKSL